MKIGDRGTTAPAGVLEPPADTRTRDRVWRAVLEEGPVSASHLAERLGLTPAAVRRHLDALAAHELVAQWRGGGGGGRRGAPEAGRGGGTGGGRVRGRGGGGGAPDEGRSAVPGTLPGAA